MTTLKMALRNIMRQRKRTFLLGGAIAFGVMIITLVGSLTAGLSQTASETFTELLGGHIYVNGEEVTDSGRRVSIIRETEPLEEALALIDDRMLDMHFRSQAAGEMIFGSKTEQVGLVGVDWETEQSLSSNLDLVAGDMESVVDERTIIVPKPVMEDLGVVVGETVLVRLVSITGQQTVGEFVIGGVTADAGTFGFSFAYTDRVYLNSIIGMGPNEYQRVNIEIANTAEAEDIAAELENELLLLGKTQPAEPESTGLPGPANNAGARVMGGLPFAAQVEDADRWEGTQFTVTTINDVMEPVVTIVTLLDQVGIALFVLLLTITMVGLLNTFRMILIERTREIGTIRAIGMQRKEVRNMFLYEALVLAIGGALAGLIVAGLLGVVFGNIPMALSGPFALFLDGNSFAFPLNPGNIAATLIILTAITLVSAYLPARKAARMRPADALRTSY
jgi:putative ABC transport system permease protein